MKSIKFPSIRLCFSILFLFLAFGVIATQEKQKEKDSQSDTNNSKKVLTTKEGLSDNNVYCMVKDSLGFIWIGTANGLNCWDGSEIKTYHHQTGNANTVAGNDILSLAADRSGNLWIATGEGINRFNLKSGKFELFSLPDTSNKSPTCDNAVTLLCDHDGTIWCATCKGLDEFNVKQNKFIHHENKTSSDATIQKANNSINQISEDRNYRLWVCTTRGLFLYEKLSGQFMKIGIGLNSGITTFNENVNCIYQDHTGSLWVGTVNGGLKAFDAFSQTFETHRWSYSSSNPFQNTCYDICETKDSKGNYALMLSTEDGIEEFGKQHVVTPESKTLKYPSRFYSSVDGIWWILTSEGLNYTQTSTQKSLTPTVLLREMKVNDSLYKWSENEKGDKVDTFDYKHNSFSFRFAVLSFIDPSKNKFFCMMEGIDKDWKEVAGGKTEYNKLKPGNYIFKMRGSDANGIMNETGDAFTFTIIAPFWQKTWFLVIIGGVIMLIVIATLIAFVRRRVKEKTI